VYVLSFFFGKSILKMGNGRILRKVFSKIKSSILAIEMDQSAMSEKNKKGVRTFFLFWGKYFEKGEYLLFEKVFQKIKSSIHTY